MSVYEQQRDETIRRNRELLQSLLKDVSIAPVNRATPPKRPAAPRRTSSTSKRVATPSSTSGSAKRATPKSSAARVLTRTPSTGTRSSARKAGVAAIDYGNDLLSDGDFGEADSDAGFSDDVSDGEDDEEGVTASGGKKRKAKPLRRHKSLTGHRPDPKVFGEQVNTRPGDWWPMRIDASQAGVHAPTVAGMSGDPQTGAWSICLSGGYPEDVDLGYAMTYTGCGGRDLKGTKDKPKNLRTAPQTSDQSFDNPLNKALQKSVETQHPVRIMRGFKNPSPFAPESGYRYDGLYRVDRAWMDVGDTGIYKVCRYALTRLPGQSPIPLHPERTAEAEVILRDLGIEMPAPAGPGLQPSASTSGESLDEVITPATEKSLEAIEGKSSPKRQRIA